MIRASRPAMHLKARQALEHANPRDTHTSAMLGILFGYSGNWTRGIELTERAMLLQPDHPGWYFFTTFFYEYLQVDYTRALDGLEKAGLDMQGNTSQ